MLTSDTLDTTQSSVRTTRVRQGWRARTRVVLPTGAVDLQALGKTRGAANNNLHQRLQALLARNGLAPETVGWAARKWREGLALTGLADATRSIYERYSESYVEGSKLSEVGLACFRGHLD